MRMVSTLGWLPAAGALALLSLGGLQGCGSPNDTPTGKGPPDASGASTGGAPGSGGAGGHADAGAGGSGGAMGTGGTPGDASPDTGGKMADGGGPSVDGGGGTLPPPPGATKLAQHVLTWYTFQDNTPVNSLFSGSGRALKPYVSVAVPRRELKSGGGTLNYGDKLYVAFLAGRMMPNGSRHTGWVQIDDFCGDAGDDSYCYQTVAQGKFPNVDLYLGDFLKTGMMASPTGDCYGPAGSGTELTDVYGGDPRSSFVTDYGGAVLGTGKCGDKASARLQQKGVNTPGESGCWGYDAQDSESDCSMCTKESCASW
jgi:hypothetical protein